MAHIATSPKQPVHRNGRRFLPRCRDVIVITVIEVLAEVLHLSLVVHVIVALVVHTAADRSRVSQ